MIQRAETLNLKALRRCEDAVILRTNTSPAEFHRLQLFAEMMLRIILFTLRVSERPLGGSVGYYLGFNKTKNSDSSAFIAH